MRRKHTLRSGISLLLALVMLFGILPLAAFAKEEKPEKILVSFGDSMTNGYGHGGYYAGSTQVNGFRQNDLTTTYPAMLKKELEEKGYDVNWEALAISCMRTEDVNFLLRYHTEDKAWNALVAELDSVSTSVENWNNTQKARWESTFVDDGNVIGDYFTWNEFVNGRFWDWRKTTGYADEDGYTWNTNPTLAYAKYYQNAVKNADVITLGTGDANFGVIMLQNIVSLLTGTKENPDGLASGFKDAVPVREVLERRLPADILPKALEILDKVDELVVPRLAMLGEEKAAKTLEIVEYTTVSFMFSYMDMLYAIDDLNDKDNLDVIMMGLMNTMDGVKIDLGNGQIFDLGALVDGITDVLSSYYFVLPVALQELKGDFENITFYVVPNDDHVEMQVSDMNDLEKIKTNNTIRERMIQEVSGMIFDLVRGSLNGALSGQGVSLPNWDGTDGEKGISDSEAPAYRERVEAYEALQAGYKAWVDGGYEGNWTPPMNGATDVLLKNPNDMLACAVYLAFEQAIIANADNATLDLAGLMSLMGGTEGLAGMMGPIAGSLTDAFSDEAQEALTAKIIKSVFAPLSTEKDSKGRNKIKPNTAAIKENIDKIISQLSAPELASLKEAYEEIKDSPIVPDYGITAWYNPEKIPSDPTSVSNAIDQFARFKTDSAQYVTEEMKTNLAELQKIFTAIEMTNALNGALGTALVEDEALGGLLSLFARMLIGNGIGSHPNAAGHETLFNEIMEVYPEYPAMEFFKEQVKEAADNLYKLAKEGNFEALNKLVDYALEKGYIDAELAEIIKTQATLAYVAAYEGDEEAALRSFQKLAALLYQSAVEKGYVPEEVQKALGEFFALYDELKDMTSDELKAWAKEQVKDLAEEYGPQALEAMNDYILGLEILDARQLAELEAKIAAFVKAYPNAPEATIDAAVEELVDFLFELTNLDRDQVVGIYTYLTTTSQKQMLEDAAALLKDYAEKYGPEVLEAVENYLIAEGYLTEEDIAEIAKQVKLALAAYETGDEAAVQASVEKLVRMLYAYADGNGYIPAELKEAIAKAVKLHYELSEMSPEEIKALVLSELKNFVAENKAEALIALESYIVSEGWMSDADLKALAEKIALTIAAYKEDPNGTANKMMNELVDYLYAKAVAEGYIDPAKIEELNQFVEMVKAACDYFANTPEEQIKAEAIARLFAELDKLTDGKVNAETYAQFKQDLVKFISLLENTSKEDLEQAVQAYINSLKEKYEALIYSATHGKFIPNDESYYIALGGDTVYGTGIGKYDDGYFDLLVNELGLDGKTQYKNLGKQKLSSTEILSYIEKNAKEIAKADLITYQADASAFIFAVLAEEDPNWMNYFTPEELAFVKEAIPAIQQILMDDWTKYVDLDVNELVDKLENAVISAVSQPVLEQFKEQDAKLQQLLAICVAQVKSYVDYLEAQAEEAAALLLEGDELVKEAFAFVNSKLSKNWAAYADLDVDEITAEIMAEVKAQLTKLENYSAIGEARLEELVRTCAAKIVEIHAEAKKEVSKLQDNLSEEQLAYAEKIFPAVQGFVLNNWPELAEIDAKAIHEQVYAWFLENMPEDDFDKEAFLAQGEETVEKVLNACENLAVDAVSNAQKEAISAVQALGNAYSDLEKAVLPIVAKVLAEDWAAYVDMAADKVVEEIQAAVLAELEKTAGYAKTYLDQYAEELKAVLTICVEEAQKLVGTVQEGKTKILRALEEFKAFESYAEKLLYACVAFAVDSVKAVETIQAINPDATLIVVGMYNPLKGLIFEKDEKSVDVGEYMEYLIKASDAYYTAFAVADGEFIFVPVPDTEINGYETSVNIDKVDAAKLGNLLLSLNESMYADVNGHEYIFEQIMGALDTSNDLPKVDNRTKESSGSYDAAVTFEDKNFTAVVTCDQACVVLAAYEDGSYIRLTAVKRSEGVYTFDLSGLSGEYVITVALKGDYNLDGSVTTNDVAQANKAVVNKTSPSKLQDYVFDMTGDDSITTNDVAKVNKSIVSKVAIEW